MSDFDLPEVNQDAEILRILKDTETFLTQHPPKPLSAAQLRRRESLAAKELEKSSPPLRRAESSVRLWPPRSNRHKIWLMAFFVVLLLGGGVCAYYYFMVGGY